MELQKLNELFEVKKQAEEELTKLFQLTNEAVVKLDENDLLLPGDPDLESFYIVWSLITPYRETSEVEEKRYKGLQESLYNG